MVGGQILKQGYTEKFSRLQENLKHFERLFLHSGIGIMVIVDIALVTKVFIFNFFYEVFWQHFLDRNLVYLSGAIVVAELGETVSIQLHRNLQHLKCSCLRKSMLLLLIHF